MSEENHVGWKLVSGVRRDVVNLFKAFADTDSVRFEDFCKVWKDMKFSLIYSHRVSFIETLEFSEELLQIVKEYLFSVYEFHTKVAALYTLYGLYFKQPIRGAAKIRFTKTEWEEVYSMVENSKKAQHYDLAFIFIKLYLNGAYSFVATVRQAGLEKGYRKYLEKRRATFNKAIDIDLLYRPLVSQKLVNSLVKLESLYCKKKAELLGDKNLIFIDGKFAETLKEDLKNYEAKCQGSTGSTSTTTQALTTSGTPEERKSKSETEGVQTRLSTKLSKSKGSSKADENDDSNGEIQTKKRKFIKKQKDLIAKNKAKFYIQKLQQNNPIESDGQNLSLSALDLMD